MRDVVEVEIENLKAEPSEAQTENAEPALNHATAEQHNDGIQPLSGNPYFDVIIAKSHIKPLFQLYIPVRLHPVFPTADIPAVLYYCGKSWEMVYKGDRARKRFDPQWKNFAIDNDLKTGDACVFELLECTSTNLKVNVQILRGDFPSELLRKVRGGTSDSPIIID